MSFLIAIEPNKLIPLIPEATDRKTIVLLEAGVVSIAKVVEQEAVPGKVRGCVVLRRTPPGTEEVNTEESPNGVGAVASRET